MTIVVVSYNNPALELEDNLKEIYSNLKIIRGEAIRFRDVSEFGRLMAEKNIKRVINL